MTEAATRTARTAGPPRFFALAAQPGGLLLAGSCGRGATRSTDGGRSWRPVDDGPGSGAIHAFSVSAGGDVLAATAGTGVHRSTDGGGTWSPVGLDGATVHAVAEVGRVMLAGVEGSGLWQSDDGGTGWSPVPGFRRATTVYRIVARAGAADIATSDGVWRYRDGRVTRSGLRGAVVYALIALDDERVAVGTCGDGVFVSADGGRTWPRAAAGLPDPVVHVLATDGDGIVYAGTGLGVARSSDGGRTWAPVGRAIAHHRIFSLAASPDVGLLAGSYDGVWILPRRAPDWQPLDVGMRADDALSLLVEPHGRAFAATSAGARHSADGGQTWTPVGPDLGDQTTYAIARLCRGQLLAGTNSGLRASDDDGRTWVPAGLGDERAYRIVEVEPGLVLVGTLGGGLWIGGGVEPWRRADDVTHPSVFDVHRADTGDLLVATGIVVDGEKTGGIFRSADRGATWQRADGPSITVYRIVELSGGALYAGAQRSRILRSTDNGTTWSFAPDTTGLVDAKLYALTGDARDRLYLGGGDQLLRSADGAATWQSIGDGLDGAAVFDVASLGDRGLLAATTWGIHRSTDDGLSWQPTAQLAP